MKGNDVDKVAVDETVAEDAQAIVEAAKAEAAKPEKPAAAAGPMVEISVAMRNMAGALTRHLVQSRPDIAQSMIAMTFSRQLYGVAVKDMEYRVAELTAEQRATILEDAIASELKGEVPAGINPADAWELVEEVVMAAAANEAARPFNETVLFANLKSSVERWLHDVVKEHVAWEKVSQQKAWDEWEKVRRVRPIPLGFKFRMGSDARDDQDQDVGDTVFRDRTLVLFGWRPAVLWLLDQITAHVLKQKKDQLFMVVRLQRQTGQVDPQTRLLRLGGKAWEDCCRSGSSWPDLFQKKILMNISDPVDLLIVDDLPYAGMSAGLSVGSLARKAGSAQRRFRQWADKTGHAVIGAILFDEKTLPAPTGSDWSQLRDHTTLRGVSVTETESTYEITVGQGFGTMTVSKDVLDVKAESKLILPD